MLRAAACSSLLIALVSASLAAQQPLDHEAYERWRSIDDERLSADGAWVAYTLTVEWGDPELVVRAARGATEYRVPRGRAPRFSGDGRWVLFEIKPGFAEVRALRRDGKKGDDLPKDSLGMLELATGEITRVADVRSFRVPEGGPWVAWLLERGAAGEPADSAPTVTDSGAPAPRQASEVGATLVLRNLATRTETRVPHVTAFGMAKGGRRLAAVQATWLGEGDGVLLAVLADRADTVRIATGRGMYRSPVFDDSGERVAFLSDRDEVEREHPRVALYHWREGWDAARRVAGPDAPGLPAGWSVSRYRAPEFSRSGERLFFGSAPVPVPEPEDTLLDDERVQLDLWHWQDPILQPQQLLEADEERRRTYLAVVHLDNNRVRQLATPEVPEVRIWGRGDGDYAAAESEVPYQMERSWDYPTYRDLYVLDLRSGERRLMAERQQSRLFLSPGQEWAVWYDRSVLAWFGRPTDGGPARNLTAAVPYPIHDVEEDRAYPPDDYGAEGWTPDGRWFLLYDRHDVWAVDMTGQEAPRAITDGVGRQANLRFRIVDLDRDSEAVPDDEPLLLSAFHYGDKRAGFFRDQVRGSDRPQELLFMPRRFSSPRRADSADVLLFTRQSVDEFPDLWVSGLPLADARKISDANPQQAEYRWADAELVAWRSVDGTPLQGLLYTPEDFDPTQRYPLMVYFYERNADNLHTHYPPYAHRSVVRPTFYASRGYVVFIPDIVYKVGYPGESAMNSVMPGVLSILERGFIDPARIGVQGHSWGGYQIAYMVTRTNLFRAAAGGAPVSNMTSAYGGIRWGSGLSRMFQYERTQSRIGGSLWEYPLRYIENSPVFWADKVETPLLMMHNDEDGAVPWEQGIEMFVALRRLGKPAWLINYNGEPHWPLPFQKRKDWNIRMQQYFDHYLRDAPAPEWLVRGIPATEKGRELGLELVTDK